MRPVSPEVWDRVIDPEVIAEELAELGALGFSPTVGWWRTRIHHHHLPEDGER